NVGHVQSDDNPSPFVILIEQRWIDHYPSALNVTLHQTNQLGKKVFPAALPRGRHQVVNLAGSFKDDPLHSEPSCQFFQMNFLQLSEIWLSVDHGSQLGDHWGLVGVQNQSVHFVSGPELVGADIRGRSGSRWARSSHTVHVALRQAQSWILPVAGGGGGASALPSCGRNVNGTPNMLTYSGWNSPVSLSTSYDVRRSPRPTTCSHRSCDVNARSPMMWVTVLASQPSDNIPTEITFWICSPGWPSRPIVSTVLRSSSARSFFVSFFFGPAPFSSAFSSPASSASSPPSSTASASTWSSAGS